jgi:hypothetical protein
MNNTASEPVTVSVDAADVAANVPAEPATPPKPSRREIGRMRRQFFTVVHDTVVACEHKFNPSKPPTLNCEYCWEAYFKTAVDLEELHKALNASIQDTIRVRGEKYVKAFRRFIANELQSKTFPMDTVDNGDGTITASTQEVPSGLPTQS